MNEEKLIIETRQLCKNFGPTIALNHVDLKFYRGQITGLIGENGSGKSTITSILAGMQGATSGEIYYKGELHKVSTMIEGAARGIGMIVQEQGYVSGITIAQNIFLGKEEMFRRHGVISRRAMVKAAQEALNRIGCPDIDASWYIDQLNIQDRKLVELARVMYGDPEVLVVDETTTALSQRGREIIYGIMRSMRDSDKCVIFISHDLDELIGICDRMVVLRDGCMITALDKEEFEPNLIKKYMVGREMGEKYYRSDWNGALSEEVVLDVDRVTSGFGLLMNFSMKVHKGEILGIGGLSHCGMHELGKVLFGEEKLLAGSITHVPSGQHITSPRQAMSLGLGYALLESNQAYVDDKNNPGELGFGTCIGYQDTEFLYLYSELAHKLVRKLCEDQGENFSCSQKSLLKALAEEGLIEPGTTQNTRPLRIGEKQKRVIFLCREKAEHIRGAAS